MENQAHDGDTLPTVISAISELVSAAREGIGQARRYLRHRKRLSGAKLNRVEARVNPVGTG